MMMMMMIITIIMMMMIMIDRNNDINDDDICNFIYLVTSERTTVTERGEETSNRVLFFDDGGSMEELFTYELDVMEQGISLTSCVFQGSSKEYIVVGTALVIPDEQEPSRGRILVFEIVGEREGEDRRLNLAMEKEAMGAVFSLVVMNGKLVAGVGSKVGAIVCHLVSVVQSSTSYSIRT